MAEHPALDVRPQVSRETHARLRGLLGVAHAARADGDNEALDRALAEYWTVATSEITYLPAEHVEPQQDAVDEALEVLRAAGWDVREDTAYGNLIGDTGVVAMAYAGVTDGWEQARTHRRTVAQQPWQPAP